MCDHNKKDYKKGKDKELQMFTEAFHSTPVGQQGRSVILKGDYLDLGKIL